MATETRATYWFMNVGEGANLKRQREDEGRSWEDCVKYGFVAVGGGEPWITKAGTPVEGDFLFAYVSKHGYVGYGQVVAQAVPFKDFVPIDHKESLLHLDLRANVQRERMQDQARWDMCVGVRWITTLEREHAVLASMARIQALCAFRQERTVDELLKAFEPDNATG